ncbi:MULTISPECIES: M24 family metallopeptidase [Sphingomonas]|uniref:Xaa-Pro aminopeptidase n=1 Tax=Sphingomonas adhaesiva TaxID=28212 RepID=A0A2A4I7U1_9SPHN|nr:MULTISPECIES: M24 family metallopeptidase [Sphingomonas]PCG14661.1 Xaa-Pro aminopeptidase [Sphingomonas adhaesiva]PZU81714.1 MAG: Xaa-Pro aminopeptidase [Sphingomonas sp.]
MTIRLTPVAIPDFGTIDEPPALPPARYAARCDAALAAAGTDWLVVYADREHMANVMFLSGFEPRFEEALLLLGPGGRRIVVTGNECVPYAERAPLPGLTVRLAQTMSLLGQDRSVAPRLTDVLRDAGLAPGTRTGIVGWKYLAAEEWDDGLPAPSFLPAAYHAAIARVVGADAVEDRTAVLLHPETGHRSIIDADQIAVFEAAAARGSAMVWSVLSQLRPGDRERDGAARMGYHGDPFNVHMMLASGGAADGGVIGLASPGPRVLRKGDGVSTAVGLWGGLTARAGLLDDADDAFVATAADYFAGLVEWYRVARVGTPGGELHDAVTGTLARGGLHSLLNPGHLTGHEEWSHTPVRPGSTERLRSGMHVQVDVIPTPMRDGWALNCEDSVVLADAALRAELADRHPAVMARIDARRRFMTDTLGVAVDETVLPLSSVPLCLAPLWLKADHLFVQE